jgi:hypothetical protein
VSFPVYGETVEVYREQRNRVGDVTHVDEQVIEGAIIAPRTSSEAGGDMRTATVRTGLTVYLPDTSGLTSAHRLVRADGTVWRVSGQPAEWRNPLTGWSPGSQIEIDRVQG